jgi:peroxiredoxin family protein
MVDVLFWQTTGYRDSIQTSLSVANSLKRMGTDVGVLFDKAALIALARNKFEISPPLTDHATTIDMNLKKMGLPTAMVDYLEKARAAGVHLYACGGWCDFLGIKGQLPQYIEEKGLQDSVKLIADAKKVIVSP